MTAELHRPVSADRIGPQGLDVTIEASPDECAALASRMQIPSILALNCRLRLVRETEHGIAAAGSLDARLVQTCVVSMEEFETHVAEDFKIRFVVAGQESDDFDLDSDDEIPFEGGVIDLGEAVAEQLALALDPYPRQPGVEMPELDPEEAAHPFAVLSSRLRTN